MSLILEEIAFRPDVLPKCSCRRLRSNVPANFATSVFIVFNQRYARFVEVQGRGVGLEANAGKWPRGLSSGMGWLLHPGLLLADISIYADNIEEKKRSLHVRTARARESAGGTWYGAESEKRPFGG